MKTKSKIRVSTPRLDRKSREIQILEAYLDLVLQIGIENITLQKVAKAADVSFATVHGYFAKSGDVLTQKAVQYVLESVQTFTAQEIEKAQLDPKRNLLKAYLQINFDWMKKFPHHSAFWVYYCHLSAIRSPYRKKNQEFLQLARARIQMLIHDGIGKGHFPKVKNAETVARWVHDQLVGAAILNLIDPAPSITKLQIESVMSAVDQFFKE